jgi:parallel beta-helix repeat protein
MIILFVSSQDVEAEDISGNITSNTTWDITGSPYIIIDNVTVDAGVNLTIDPGAIVKYYPEKSMFVYGNISAIGTSSEKIRFTAVDPDSEYPNYCIYSNGGWGRFENCEISYFSYGLRFRATSNLSISNLKLDHIDYYGIDIIISSNISISNCSLKEEMNTGIDISYCINAEINDISFWNITGPLSIFGGEKIHYDHKISNISSDGRPVLYFHDISNDSFDNISANQIIVTWSNNISFTDCNLSNGRGLYLYYTHNSSINDCIFSNNRYGICLYKSNTNEIRNSSFNSNYIGISFYDSSDENKVLSCNFSSNTYGIETRNDAEGNIVSLCNISHNEYGIYLYSDSNTISKNDIYSNYYGIYMYFSGLNTLFHNNVIDNRRQVFDGHWGKRKPNVWSYEEEGNYWSDYSGDDIGGDNIGDDPYYVTGLDKDYYPLMFPYNGTIPPDTKPPQFIVQPNIPVRDLSVPWQEFFISFRINEEGHYEVVIDTDGVEGFDNSSDTVLSGKEGPGTCDLFWDGSDSTGNFSIDGTFGVQVTIWDAVGNRISEPFDAGMIRIEVDTDFDGVKDLEDAFPNDPEEWEDYDNDGIGDNSDDDLDNDGYKNDVDEFPRNQNEWKDSDGDGIGDNGDDDANGNGIPDAAEIPLGTGLIMAPVIIFYFINKRLKGKKDNNNLMRIDEGDGNSHGEKNQ